MNIALDIQILIDTYENRKRKIDIKIAKLQSERSTVDEHRLDLMDLLEKVKDEEARIKEAKDD